MPLEELRAMLRAERFQPFRIHLTDGSHYDVWHRNFCMPAARSVAIGVPAGTGNGVPEHIVLLALIHITRLEPLDPGPALT